MWLLDTIQIIGLNVIELLAVKGLQSTIHAEIEQTSFVLHHAINIIAGHTIILLHFFFKDMKLVTVIAVKTISCGNPYKAVTILINLSCKAA